MTYSPTLGRWLQQDPAGYVDGQDIYVFARDRPVASVDPLGLDDLPVQSVPDWMHKGVPTDVDLASANFKLVFLDGRGWSRSRLVLEAANNSAQGLDAKQRWQRDGNDYQTCHWKIYGHIETYTHRIVASFSTLSKVMDSKSLGMAVDAFNARAAMHEKDVIKRLQQIWSPDENVPLGEDPQPILDKAFGERTAKEQSFFGATAKYELSEVLELDHILQEVLGHAAPLHEDGVDALQKRIDGARKLLNAPP